MQKRRMRMNFHKKLFADHENENGLNRHPNDGRALHVPGLNSPNDALHYMLVARTILGQFEEVTYEDKGKNYRREMSAIDGTDERVIHNSRYMTGR